MSRIQFERAVSNIVERDSSYEKDVYFFLRDALEFTVKKYRSDELEEHRHVAGKELLDGFRDYALKELGSMTVAVLESWGVHSSGDIGAIVYQLIEEGAFGSSEDDHPADFETWMSFEEAFQVPFRPRRNVLRKEVPNQHGSDTILESNRSKPTSPN